MPDDLGIARGHVWASRQWHFVSHAACRLRGLHGLAVTPRTA
jgi:hypothetical protein